MKIHTIFNLSDSYQRTIYIKIKRQCGVVIAILIFLIVSLPEISLAQPIADGKSKFLGCAIDDDFHSHFTDYWNQVSPGNAGKWGSVEYSQDQYNWTQLDNIYNYTLSNDFLYKHHTLVWGSQQPTWITSLDSTSQREQIEEWIQLVGERYPGMDFIDVVNEPLNAPPSYMNALGGTGVTGWDWVITAFQLARQYCAPGVKLLINEYNILQSNSITDDYLVLIDLLKTRELIDGIGIQGHYFEFKSAQGQEPVYSYPISTLEYNLDRLAATDIPIYISEFDINEADGNIQLENYQTYFPLFWEHPGVLGITLWGYVEWDVWKANAYLITDRNVERPALPWLRTYIKSPFPPTLISPVNILEVPRNPLILWYSSESATSYHIQMATNSVFVSIVLDTIVTDTLIQMSLIDSNERFYWRVSASNEHGSSEYSETASFITGENITAIEESEVRPAEFKLFQNYPNPFNPSTNINYDLPITNYVELSIYNFLGQKIATLVSEKQKEGYHQVEWDAREFSSGVYFYRIESGEIQDVKKMILIK